MTGYPRTTARLGSGVLQRVGAACLLALVSPILVVAGAWVRTVGGRPVFIRSERVGRDQSLFLMLKLRTMRLPRDGEVWPRTYAAGDPRLIRGGAWLRRH